MIKISKKKSLVTKIVSFLLIMNNKIHTTPDTLIYNMKYVLIEIHLHNEQLDYQNLLLYH